MDEKIAKELIDKVALTVELAHSVRCALTRNYEMLASEIEELRAELNLRVEALEKIIGEVRLKEALRGIGYSEREVEECLADVPDLTIEDVEYVKPLYDNYDPQTQEWGIDTFADYSEMKIFPKLETRALRKMRSCLVFETLAYIPLFDTSGVVEAISPWSKWQDGTIDKDLDNIKRMPAFDWSSLERQTYLFCALHNLEKLPRMSFPKLDGNCRFMWGDCYKLGRLDVDLDWGKVTDFWGGMRDVPAEELPAMELPKCTTLGSAWSNIGIKDMSEIRIWAPKCTNGSQMFTTWGGVSRPRIEQGPVVELAAGANVKGMFAEQKNLKVVPEWSDFEPGDITQIFVYCSGLERVEGLRFGRVTVVDSLAFYSCSKLKYLRIMDLGKSALATYDFSYVTNWGSGGEENRRSLVDSLLTDSFDRVAAGMPVAKVWLSRVAHNNLTNEEKAAITAKGFTLG